jgi:hypothetical protein
MFVRLGWQARARKRIYYRLHAHRYPEGLRTKFQRVPVVPRRAPVFKTRKRQKVVTRSVQHVAINSAISWSK